MFRIYILAVFFFIPFHSCAQHKNAVNLLKENSIEIIIDPNSLDFDDLQPLKDIFRGKRIIGMGEATHGSSEFFQIKHRMLEFLVEEMGYRLFGIEANFTECRYINDYVLNGKGDINEAIAWMRFWTWRTHEVLDMVEWMKAYNEGRTESDKVKFYGFDMQSDWLAIPLVTQKLRQYDNSYFNEHFLMFETLEITDRKTTLAKQHTEDEKLDIIKLITSIKDYIKKHKQALTQMFSSEEFACLERDVRLVEQCFYTNEIEDGVYIRRDEFMAENIRWILDHEGNNSKIMLWAHNGHITKSILSSRLKSKGMGYYLKKIYGEEYYAIGMDFYNGNFRAVDTEGLKVLSAGNAIKNSTGEIFSRIGKASFFIDIEGTVGRDANGMKFFSKRIWRREIGAGFTPTGKFSYYNREPLYDCFDGLIFINTVSASVPCDC